MQKGTVSQRSWNAVNGANQITMNWWLFEGCKREQSMKGGEKHSRELLGIHCNVGCLREAKGNGLLILLELSQRSCPEHKLIVVV